MSVPGRWGEQGGSGQNFKKALWDSHRSLAGGTPCSASSGGDSVPKTAAAAHSEITSNTSNMKPGPARKKRGGQQPIPLVGKPQVGDEKVACVHITGSAFDQKQGTKVIIRRLPDELSAMDFLNSLENLVHAQTLQCYNPNGVLGDILWIHFRPSRQSSDGAIRSVPTHAFIKFGSSATAETFIAMYQNHTFLGKNAVVHRPAVGLAPCQRLLVPLDELPGAKYKDPADPLAVVKYYRRNLDDCTKRFYASPDRKASPLESSPFFQEFVKRVSQEDSLMTAWSSSGVRSTPQLATVSKPVACDPVTPLVKSLLEQKAAAAATAAAAGTSRNKNRPNAVTEATRGGRKSGRMRGFSVSSRSATASRVLSDGSHPSFDIGNAAPANTVNDSPDGQKPKVHPKEVPGPNRAGARLRGRGWRDSNAQSSQGTWKPKTAAASPSVK